MSEFELQFAGKFGVQHAFSFWKARVALYACLKALGVGPGDEVILPGYTCVMDVNPIKYLGAKPVYVDIEPDTFNINPDLIERKITPRSRVLIAQHTYGYPCRLDRLVDIAQRHKLVLVEDCCLAFGSTYKGRLVGSFGAAAYFSFQWNKPFTTGLGGMLITNDGDLADKIHCLRETGMCRPGFGEVAVLAAELAVYRLFIYPRTTALSQRLFRYLAGKQLIVGSYSPVEYTPEMPAGFFKGMSCVQSCAGVRQLKKLESNLTHRRKMTRLYDRLLSDKGFPPRRFDSGVCDPVLVRYPLRVAEKVRAVEEAGRCGIEIGNWFECPLHQIGTSFDRYDYVEGMCPEAEKAAREVINLPVHPRVSEKTVRRTVEFVTGFRPA